MRVLTRLQRHNAGTRKRADCGRSRTTSGEPQAGKAPAGTSVSFSPR